jgi:hypothetical protein
MISNISRSSSLKRPVFQCIGDANDPIQGGADLMTHVRKELALGRIRLLGPLHGLHQLVVECNQLAGSLFNQS